MARVTDTTLHLLPGADEFPRMTDASCQLLWACSCLESSGQRVFSGMPARWVGRHLGVSFEDQHASAVMRGLVSRRLLCSQMIGAPKVRVWDLTPLGERLGMRLRSDAQLREAMAQRMRATSPRAPLAQTLFGARQG